MKLEQFAKITGLIDKPEIERCALIVFFLTREEQFKECNADIVLRNLNLLHLPLPNKTRLVRNASLSTRFIRASKNHFRLHASAIAEYSENYPSTLVQSEEIVSGDAIIPRDIYTAAPTYVVRLADQINASYENNIFDGCAVLMRRMLEILLIRLYEFHGIQDEIKSPDGNYKMLEGIVSNAKSNAVLHLSRTTKNRFDDYRALGNFAAHRIEYGTRRGDIKNLQLDYRATVEELLHKSSLIR